MVGAREVGDAVVGACEVGAAVVGARVVGAAVVGARVVGAGVVGAGVVGTLAVVHVPRPRVPLCPPGHKMHVKLFGATYLPAVPFPHVRSAANTGATQGMPAPASAAVETGIVDAVRAVKTSARDAVGAALRMSASSAAMWGAAQLVPAKTENPGTPVETLSTPATSGLLSAIPGPERLATNGVVPSAPK